MNQIKSRLITNAKNILEHVERIQQSVGKVPQIDIDILLSSIREMYEVALSADKANAAIDAYNAVSECFPTSCRYGRSASGIFRRKNSRSCKTDFVCF